MLMRTRCVSAALVVSFVLALGIQTAVADVEVSATSIRATASALTFGTPEFGEVSIVCPVTMAITLASERTRIVERAVAGSVTDVRITEGSCTGGRVRFLAERLPLTLRLVSFREGVIRLQADALSALITDSTGFARCLMSGNLQVTNVNDPITSFRVDETVTSSLVTRLGGLFCPRTGFLRGELRPTPQVVYTESDNRGKPLQPQAASLSFFQTVGWRRTVEFTNTNWLYDVNVNRRGVLGASRFREIAEGSECLSERRIERRCFDRIELIRTGTEGPMEYLVLYDEKVMGSVQLIE